MRDEATLGLSLSTNWTHPEWSFDGDKPAQNGASPAGFFPENVHPHRRGASVLMRRRNCAVMPPTRRCACSGTPIDRPRKPNIDLRAYPFSSMSSYALAGSLALLPLLLLVVDSAVDDDDDVDDDLVSIIDASSASSDASDA